MANRNFATHPKSEQRRGTQCCATSVDVNPPSTSIINATPGQSFTVQLGKTSDNANKTEQSTLVARITHCAREGVHLHIPCSRVTSQAKTHASWRKAYFQGLAASNVGVTGSSLQPLSRTPSATRSRVLGLQQPRNSCNITSNIDRNKDIHYDTKGDCLHG